MDENLLVALFYAGRFEEAASFGAPLPSSDLRNGILIAAAAARCGASQAVAEAQSLVRDADARRSALDATQSLIVTRRYNEAVAIASEAARGAGNARERQARIDFIKHFRRHETLKMADDEPVGVAMRFLQLVSQPHRLDEKAWRALFAREVNSFITQELLFEQKQQDGMSDDVIRDIALTMFELDVHAVEPWGYRVQFKSRPPMAAATAIPDLFVAREGKRYRIVGTADSLATLGARALALADRNELAGAGAWLDMAASASSAQAIGVRELLGEEPFESLWGKDRKRNRDAIRWAAAALLGKDKRGAKLALPILERCAQGKGAEAMPCQQALLYTYTSLGRHEQVLGISRGLLAQNPDAFQVFQWHTTALGELAAVHAARNEMHHAYQSLIESMDAGKTHEIRPQDWLVDGRIAQGHGLRDIARAAYARVKKDDDDTASSSHALARKWLAELDK